MAAETPAARPTAQPAADVTAAVLASGAALVPVQAGPSDGEFPAIPQAVGLPAVAQQPLVQPLQVNVQVAAPTPQVVISIKQRGLFVRALYYEFVGWWLSGLMMLAAGVCIASVVLLPAGLAMVNQLPQVMTLRPRSTTVNAAMLTDGSVQYTVGSAQQRSMLVRTAYFCLVGWWAGMFVMFAAWLLSVLIVTMPLGLMLLNRVPAAVTLRRN